MLSPNTRAQALFADESFADQESLRDSFRLWLHFILQVDSELTTVSQKSLKLRHIVWRCDEKNVAYARQHQRAQRIINHRLVVNRQQAFSHGMRDGIQTRSGATGQNDSFICCAAYELGHWGLSVRANRIQEA